MHAARPPKLCDLPSGPEQASRPALVSRVLLSLYGLSESVDSKSNRVSNIISRLRIVHVPTVPFRILRVFAFPDPDQGSALCRSTRDAAAPVAELASVGTYTSRLSSVVSSTSSGIWLVIAAPASQTPTSSLSHCRLHPSPTHHPAA